MYDTNLESWNPAYAKPTTEESVRNFAERLIADRNRNAPAYMRTRKVLDVEVL